MKVGLADEAVPVHYVELKKKRCCLVLIFGSLGILEEGATKIDGSEGERRQSLIYLDRETKRQRDRRTERQ